MGAGLLAGLIAGLLLLMVAVGFVGIVALAKELDITPEEIQKYREALGIALVPSILAIWQTLGVTKLNK